MGIKEILQIAALLFIFFVLYIEVRRRMTKVWVNEYQYGVLYKEGKFCKLLPAGGHWIFQPAWRVAFLDKRQRFATVQGQELISADKIGLKLSVAAMYKIVDPLKALHEVDSYEQHLHLIVQLVLRSIIADYSVDDVLSKRQEISKQLFDATNQKILEFGLELQSIDIKDVMFPGELKKIFAEVVRAQKEGQAALERARGEAASLRSLANSAKMLENNPALLNLRILQAAQNPGTTVVLGTQPNLTSGGITSAGI